MSVVLRASVRGPVAFNKALSSTHSFLAGGADAQTLVGSDASDGRDAPLCGSVATWLCLRARVR